ncbi:MAG TPA: methyltransferase domain-containing protein [Solirubrobacterales bacterium]|nr:methyltransferase domain-containing protein [Solirubrobacterales bacterium]
MTAASDAVRWHEVECAGYAADLALWEELAGAAGGPVLELGCGTGRVALHLARAGHDVAGIDTDEAFVAELNARAEEEDLPAHAEPCDTTEFDLGRSFALVLAPMQLIQLLPDEAARSAALDRIADHLGPGGAFAAALVEDRHIPAYAGDGAAPLPDVRERDGWVFSSLPRSVRREEGRLTIERLRHAIAPDGGVSEQVDITHLSPLSAAQLGAEARDAGLRPAGTREVVATHWHVGSTVVILEAA